MKRCILFVAVSLTGEMLTFKLKLLYCLFVFLFVLFLPGSPSWNCVSTEEPWRNVDFPVKLPDSDINAWKINGMDVKLSDRINCITYCLLYHWIRARSPHLSHHLLNLLNWEKSDILDIWTLTLFDILLLVLNIPGTGHAGGLQLLQGLCNLNLSHFVQICKIKKSPNVFF